MGSSDVYALYERAFKNDALRKLWTFKVASSSTVVDPASKKVYAMSGVQAVAYDLGDGAALTSPGALTPLDPDAASISSDNALFEVQTDQAIAFVDLKAGSVLKRDIPGLGDDYAAASAFVPNSRDVLVGTGNGRVFRVNVESGSAKTSQPSVTVR